MKITKLGHCCMIIEEGGAKILADPGDYSESQNEATGIDVVLITHEHGDHCYIPSLQAVLLNNPKAKVYTNVGVAELLKQAGIAYELLEDGGQVGEQNVSMSAFGTEHREMYPGVKNVPNTGYLIANRFFYPGDAFTDPGVPVEILALPIAGPWLKMAEAIDYALKLKPKVCFPVHDGNYSEPPGSIKNFPTKFLEPEGVKYEVFELGKTHEF